MAGLFSSLLELLFGKSSGHNDEFSGHGHDDEFSKYKKSDIPTSPTPKKEDVRELVEKVQNSDYIRNLRVGRSWVLPQMVNMCFDESGNFSEEKYYENIGNMSYEKCWKFLTNTYKLLDYLNDIGINDYEERSKWWTKEVAVAMAKNDLELLLKKIRNGQYRRDDCKGGPYVYLPNLRYTYGKKEKSYFIETPPADYKNRLKQTNDTVEDLANAFRQRIEEIEKAEDTTQLCDAICDYDARRCFFAAETGESLPEAFVNAYAGDGAYYAMMTMVKYLNICIQDSWSTRDESLAAIRQKSAEVGLDGRALFHYCGEKFFNKNTGGAFDYHKYRKDLY